MKNKLIASAALSIAFLASSVTPAFAETSTPSTSTPNQRQQERFEQNRQAACEKVTERIENQKEKFEERAAATQELFETQDARLESLMDKAQDQGVDISQLEVYLDVWQAYTGNIRDNRADVAAQIDAAVDLVCAGDREGARAAFTQAREMIADNQEIRAERREYWVNTIKPELRNIHDQLLELRNAQSSNDEASETSTSQAV